MDKLDVFVWVDGEDGAGASLSVRALKAKMKAPVGEWFLLAAKNEKLERLGYDLGMKALVRPADLAALGPLAASHGEAPLVLLWSAEAVLVADWTPWQNDRAKLWETCPSALLRREDLPGVGVKTWSDFQGQSTLENAPLPASQVKVLDLKEFEKVAHGSSWPFGPSVVILEKSTTRR